MVSYIGFSLSEWSSSVAVGTVDGLSYVEPLSGRPGSLAAGIYREWFVEAMFG